MGPHRADIRRDDGLVIELQASSISAEEIAEREAFYGEMVWLLDGREFVLDESWLDYTGARVGESVKMVGVAGCCAASSPSLCNVLRSRPPCARGKHVFQRRTDMFGGRTKRGEWATRGGRYLRYTNETPVYAVWRHRLRSFDRVRAPVYIDLGPNGVFEVVFRGPAEVYDSHPEHFARHPAALERWLKGFYHSREEFATAAGLTWRADALGD